MSGGRCWQEQAGPGAPRLAGRDSLVAALPKPGRLEPGLGTPRNTEISMLPVPVSPREK